jgi:hypothetical protein
MTKTPQKNKIKPAIWSSNTSTEYVLKGNEISMLKSHLHSHVYYSIVANSKKWKQPKCSSTDKWIKNVYTHNRILFSHKKNEILSFGTT